MLVYAFGATELRVFTFVAFCASWNCSGLVASYG